MCGPDDLPSVLYLCHVDPLVVPTCDHIDSETSVEMEEGDVHSPVSKDKCTVPAMGYFEHDV